MCMRCEDCHSIYIGTQVALCIANGHVGWYDDEEYDHE